MESNTHFSFDLFINAGNVNSARADLCIGMTGDVLLLFQYQDTLT